MLSRGRRQGGEHAEVPEQHEEQQRDVADELDVGAGQGRQQPVARQPQQADGEADAPSPPTIETAETSSVLTMPVHSSARMVSLGL